MKRVPRQSAAAVAAPGEVEAEDTEGAVVVVEGAEAVVGGAVIEVVIAATVATAGKKHF